MTQPGQTTTTAIVITDLSGAQQPGDSYVLWAYPKNVQNELGPYLRTVFDAGPSLEVNFANFLAEAGLPADYLSLDLALHTLGETDGLQLQSPSGVLIYPSDDLRK